MSYKKEKGQVRSNLRRAVKLREADLITQEQLREVARDALVWEITKSLEDKIERKSRRK